MHGSWSFSNSTQQQQQQQQIPYLSRVKCIITGSLVVYIMALNSTKYKTKKPTDTTNSDH